MPTETAAAPQRTCFVVMGFGKKTDFETGRVLDLDKSYRNMIKPAVEAAGLKCVRADEIVHSGLIDVPMYQQLLEADVVVADLSTSNKNAFYELGIRHALRPFSTIIVAEDGIKTFPFDISHVAVRQYRHLGDDIGFDEVMRFRELLTGAIQTIVAQNPLDQDSPVYTFLQGLTPPALAAQVQAAVQSTQESVEQTTHSVLMAQVAAAQQQGDWKKARDLLETVRLLQQQARANTPADATPEDPYILQQLALATYKSKYPTEREALLQAHALLHVFDPSTSNDTETLGMWGAIHKRLWFSSQDEALNVSAEEQAEYLNEAIRAYGRGFYLRNDFYTGINYAFMLNARAAAATDPAEAIADFVRAQHARREVQQICDQWLQQHPAELLATMSPEAAAQCAHKRYWALATKAEAALGLGDEAQALQLQQQARSLGLDQQATEQTLEPWMLNTMQRQFDKLRDYLAHSPLDVLKR